MDGQYQERYENIYPRLPNCEKVRRFHGHMMTSKSACDRVLQSWRFEDMMDALKL